MASDRTSTEREHSTAREHFAEDELSLSDRLAIERTRLANERTLLAYARTAIMLWVTGGTLWKFFADTPSIHAAAWTSIALGTAVLVFGAARFRAMRREFFRN